jgi:uncharacterized OB-fold protein
MNQKPLPEVKTFSAPYWSAAREERFVIQHCKACGAYNFYPRPFCPKCFGLEFDWLEASGEGEVLTYSVVYQAPYPSYAPDAPYILAVIKLKEGPPLMANVLNCPKEAMKVGLKVHVCFEERQGAFKVPQFTPIG